MNTPQTTRYRCAEEADAAQWTGSNDEQLRAFCGSNFDTIDPEGRVEDPDETAAVRAHPHGGWLGLKPGDWVVKHADHFSVASDEEFRGRWAPVPAPSARTVDEERRNRYAAPLFTLMRQNGWDGERTEPVVREMDLVLDAVLAVADAEQAELRRERDLAIAHDRQPYPTAWAYEQACKTLRRKEAAIERGLEFAASLDETGREIAGPDAVHPVAAHLRHLLETRPVAGEEQQPASLAERIAAKRQEPAFVQLADAWSTDGGLVVEEQPTTNTPEAEPETVHGCPPDGSGLTPCCGRNAFELPRADRITRDPDAVTCPAAAPQPGPQLPDHTVNEEG